MEENKDICKVEENKEIEKDPCARMLARFFMVVLTGSVSACIIAIAIFFIRWLFGL